MDHVAACRASWPAGVPCANTDGLERNPRLAAAPAFRKWRREGKWCCRSPRSERWPIVVAPLFGLDGDAPRLESPPPSRQDECSNDDTPVTLRDGLHAVHPTHGALHLAVRPARCRRRVRLQTREGSRPTRSRPWAAPPSGRGQVPRGLAVAASVGVDEGTGDTESRFGPPGRRSARSTA